MVRNLRNIGSFMVTKIKLAVVCLGHGSKANTFLSKVDPILSERDVLPGSLVLGHAVRQVLQKKFISLELMEQFYF